MANFSLRQLRYFISTVENGGIAQASRHLNISQPSISVAIKELEAAFKLQLFIRNRATGLSLTPAGHRFHAHAMQLQGRAREFEQKAMGETSRIAGEIALGCFETIAPLYASSLIASFQALHPDATIRLHIGAQDKINEGLRSGAYDIALCYTHGLAATARHVGLLPDMMPRAVLPKGHVLAGAGPVSLAMLAAEPLVLLDIWPSNQYFLSMFEAANVTPRIGYHAPSLEMVRGLVGHGLGFSVLVTEPVNGVTFDGKEVVTVPLSDSVQPSRLAMAWHGGSELTRSTRAFLTHCQMTIRPPDRLRQPAPAESRDAGHTTEGE